MPDLGSTLSLNSSNFGAGIAEARAKLTELNTALIENRNKMKEVNKEASELQKQEKALAESMKDGGTKEQQEEMQRLRDRIGQVNAELGTLKTREREIQSDIRKTSNELDNQKNGMNNLANAGDNATNAVKRLETGLKSVITMAAGKKLFDYFIGSNAEMEQYTTSFEVMLGDMKKAQNLMGELTDMAAVTPMEITDIVPIGTLLMNYGVAADELVDKMTQLGDLSQGNATKFQRVATAYGQMLAKGKVTGEELRQMTEAGVPLLQALADTLGVTTAEVQDMISKSKVGITELDAAIASMTTGTGQFAGMMEKQSQTFSGMLSTLKDNIAQFGRDAGEDAFLVVKQSLAELMAMLDEWREDGTLEKIAYELGETVEGVINILKGAIGFIWNTKEGILALAVAMGTFKAAINIGNLINATVTAIRSYKNAVDAAKVSQIVFNAVGAANPFVLIVSLAASAIGALITFGMTAHDAGENVKQLSNEIKTFGESAKSAAKEQAQLEDIIKEYENISDSVDDTIDKKDELAELQERLNSLYGDEKTGIDLVNGSYEEQIGLLRDLSSAEKTRQINRVTADLEEAKKKAKTEANASILHPLDFGGDKSDGIKNIIEDVIAETRKDFDYNDYYDDWTFIDTDENMKAVLAQQIKEYTALQNAILETGEANGLYAVSYNQVFDKLEALKAIQDGIISGEEALAILNGEVSLSFDEVGDSAENAANKVEMLSSEERKKTIDDLSEATKNLVTEYSSLSDSLKTLQEGEAISYDKMQALINIYPELAKHVQVTTDGYVVENGALGDLNTALMNGINAQIEAENAKTRAAIEGANERMRLYQKEAESQAMYERNPEKMRSIQAKMNEEAAYIAELESRKILNNSLPDYINSNKGNSKKTGGNKKEDDTPTFKTISSGAKTVSSAFAEMQKSGELALATVQSVIDAGYEGALSYDEVTGKWTISAKAYEIAANKQIEEAKKAEGVTKIQCSALDSLKGILDEVTAGTYGAAKATEKLKDVSVSGTVKNMKSLAKAVAEQKKNGSLSSDTVSELVETRYSAALAVDVEGKIRINTNELEAILSEEIDKAIEELTKKLETAEKGDVPGIKAQIQAFKELKATISDVASGIYGSEIYEAAYKSYESSVNDRIKLIDKELEEKKKAKDETLKYIEEEIQARKRLNEDNDIQKQIDAVNAQLNYAQLDEFSRHQLERKLSGLKDEQAELAWQRSMEDKKAAVNAEYEEAEAYASEEKEKLDNAVNTVKEIMTELASGITNILNVVNTAITNNNTTNNNTANVSFATQNFTPEQIIKIVSDYFGVNT